MLVRYVEATPLYEDDVPVLLADFPTSENSKQLTDRSKKAPKRNALTQMSYNQRFVFAMYNYVDSPIYQFYKPLYR